MKKNRLLIKNANIVSSESIITADIFVEDGIIKDISQKIEKESGYIIDAGFNYVSPGGVDPHIHLALNTAHGNTADDFYEGSLAALAGGTTTFIDFVTPCKNESLIDALDKRLKESGKSLIDYALHHSIVSWHTGIENEIIKCVRDYGIRSIKVYLAYQKTIGVSGKILEKVMEIASKYNLTVLCHCEDGNVVDNLRTQYIENGLISPINHIKTRPPETEINAIKTAVALAEKTGARLYVVHVSTQKGLQIIANARNRGVNVVSETCPHYLIFNESDFIAHKHPEILIMSPPLRSKKDNDFLWKSIKSKDIDVISTDHCAFMLKDKLAKADFTLIPNGIAGLETRMILMFNEGVMKSKMTINDMVAVCCENPSKIFNLWPRKGVIKKDADADIVIWNKCKGKILNKNLHHKADHTVYEGFSQKMYPETVICGGAIACHKGILKTENLKGRYL